MAQRTIKHSNMAPRLRGITYHRLGGVAEAGSEADDASSDAASKAVDVEHKREDLLNLVLESAGDLIAAHVGHG